MSNFSFRLYFEAVEEQIPPAPAGVDPEMWANPSYRKFWAASNPQAQQKPDPQAKVAPKPIAKALGGQRNMSLTDIENSIISYLKGVGSTADSGLVSNLGKTDVNTWREIERMARSGGLNVAANQAEARRRGTGVHFFKSPKGLAFLVVGPGIAPMSRPFGTY